MQEKLVSILIPCYNAENYLEDCLSSILNQDYDKIETIIVNDGSTDNSEKIINKYIEIFKNNGKRLTKINQKNSGQAAACNKGLKYVKGEYLYWQDSDDLLEDGAIRKMVDFLENNTEYDMVRGKVAIRKEEDYNNIVKIGKPKDEKKTNLFNEYVFEKDTYCFGGIFLVRMSYFDKCNPKRELYVSSGGQNYQLLLPILFKGKCGYINSVVYNYRIRRNSHSHSLKLRREKIDRANNQETIILNTFNRISNMNLLVKNIYILAVKIKYLKRKMVIIIVDILKKMKGQQYDKNRR